MKVAVASPDGKSISEHFGRSTCFLVYEVVGGEILDVEVREIGSEAMPEGSCEVQRLTNLNIQLDGYQELVATLEHCRAVLCRGMGWRAAQELVRSGINPLVIQNELTPLEAVQRYIDGGLTPASGFCRTKGRPESPDTSQD